MISFLLAAIIVTTYAIQVYSFYKLNYIINLMQKTTNLDEAEEALLLKLALLQPFITLKEMVFFCTASEEDIKNRLNPFQVDDIDAMIAEQESITASTPTKH